MTPRVVCAIAFSVAALVATKSAFAADERDVQFTLATHGADASHLPLADCGGDAAIELAVEERVHRRVFIAPELSDITLSIAFAGDGSRAIIVESSRVGVELGRREVPLPANDCAESLETIAVVLAIMIGPERRRPNLLPAYRRSFLHPSRLGLLLLTRRRSLRRRLRLPPTGPSRLSRRSPSERAFYPGSRGRSKRASRSEHR